MTVHQRQLRKRWLLALGVVAVIVHLLAGALMAGAMVRGGQPPALAGFTMALCTTAAQPPALTAATVDATRASVHGAAVGAPVRVAHHSDAHASPPATATAQTADADHDHGAPHRCCDLCGACNAPAAAGGPPMAIAAADAAPAPATRASLAVAPRHEAHASQAPRAPPATV